MYDRGGAVMGYVRLRTEHERIAMTIGHNFDGGGLLLSFDYGGINKLFDLDNKSEFWFDDNIDLEGEVFASIMRRRDSDIELLCSGIINSNGELKTGEQKTPEPTPPPMIQTAAAREVDQLLRKLCNYDTDGLNACTQCPYRDSFYFISEEVTQPPRS